MSSGFQQGEKNKLSVKTTSKNGRREKKAEREGGAVGKRRERKRKYQKKRGHKKN
jgi:hypothetical protein